MQNFNYKAIDEKGQVTLGKLNARDYREAVSALENRGLTVISLDLEQLDNSLLNTQANTRDVPTKELIIIFYELTTMLRAGVPLFEVISALCKSGHSPAAMTRFNRILSSLKSGASFTQSIKDADLKLPEYIFHLSEAGELTGKLAEALDQGVQQMEYEQQLRSNTRNALIYPGILVTSGFLAVGIMFLFVVPKFSSLLESENELPLLAYLVLSSGTWLNENLVLALSILALGAVSVIGIWKIPSIKVIAINYFSRVPIVGHWINDSDIAVWAKMLSVLLSNKVPLLIALSLASRSSRIPWRKLKMSVVIKKVKGGNALSHSLEQEAAVTPTAINLIRVGEKAGELPNTLASVARLYDQASRNRMKSLLALIEPIAILFIGSAIGTIILGIVLAITSANDIAI